MQIRLDDELPRQIERHFGEPGSFPGNIRGLLRQVIDQSTRRNDVAFQFVDQLDVIARLDRLDDRLKTPHRRLDLREVQAIAARQTNREVANAGGKLVVQLLK